VTEHTHFAVGSTTKAFTASGISFLVEDNEKYPHIQWASPVHSIIPDDVVLSDDWYTTHVTISDALSHRSGLPRHDMTWAFNTSSPREAVRKLRHLPITEPIRTKWMYNNMMYIAMGHLISSVTGQTLGDFFRTHIWEPLGMHETYISFAEAQAARPEVVISKGYYTSRNGSRIDVGDYDLQAASGAGNIVSSAADYAKWLRSLLSRSPPLSQSAHAQLTQAHSIIGTDIFDFESAGFPITYGYGWDIRSYHGELLISHGGNQPGYSTLVSFLPHRNFGLVMFANNMLAGDIAIQALAYELIDDLLEIPDPERRDRVAVGDEVLRLINSVFTKEVLQLVYPNIPDPPLPLPANLSAFTGLYTHAAYPPLNITHIESQDQCAGDLLPSLRNDTEALKLCIMNFRDGADSVVVGEIMHVSGDFWIFGAEFAGMPSLTRVHFRLGPDGSAQQVGMLMEPEMKGGLIWWERVGGS
jgi:CubicO group peptidase (beta-lactamase class C family)